MRARPTTSLLAVAGLVLALSGCADDKDDPDGAPSPSATSSGTTSPDPSSSAPTDAAASGQLVTLESTATFHLTDDPGWTVSGDKTTIVIADVVPEGADGFFRLEVAEFPQIGDDLASMGETARKTAQRDTDVPLEKAPNRTYAGVEGYVFQGTGPDGGVFEWGGLDADNVLTTFSFTIPAGVDAAAWVDPILSSIAWQ